MYIIDQARGQDGWILAEFSFCVFMDRDDLIIAHLNKSFIDEASSVKMARYWPRSLFAF